jgi:hypothetical protein
MASDTSCNSVVMPGLVPGIHVFLLLGQDMDGQDMDGQDMDGRDKPGHDGVDRIAP